MKVVCPIDLLSGGHEVREPIELLAQFSLLSGVLTA